MATDKLRGNAPLQHWRRDVEAGEHDHRTEWYGHDVHSITEPGGLCSDWPDSGGGDGSWDYDQETVPFWWYQAIVPPSARKPHLST